MVEGVALSGVSDSQVCVSIIGAVMVKILVFSIGHNDDRGMRLSLGRKMRRRG